MSAVAALDETRDAIAELARVWGYTLHDSHHSDEHDLTLVHPRGGVVLFVLIRPDRMRRSPLSAAQAAWRTALLRAGALHDVVHLPSELRTFADRLEQLATRGSW